VASQGVAKWPTTFADYHDDDDVVIFPYSDIVPDYKLQETKLTLRVPIPESPCCLYQMLPSALQASTFNVNVQPPYFFLFHLNGNYQVENSKCIPPRLQLQQFYENRKTDISSTHLRQRGIY
jgi:hypothetical protein